MTTSTVPEDVRAYLGAVRTRLDDLPEEEARDLLADVEPSIVESAEEGDGPVELRLGPPDAFADELRAAAGLPPRAAPGTGRAAIGLRPRLAALAASLSTRPAIRRLASLAPVWWVLRGFVLICLVEMALGRSVLTGRETGELILVMALATGLVVAASVAIGVRRPRRTAPVVLANLVLVLGIVPAAVHVVDAAQAAGHTDTVFVEAGGGPRLGLWYDGGPVYNVYAYDRNGRLLQDVRLFDNFGRPIEIGGVTEDPLRRPVRTRGGIEVFNAFPIRYFEPGTRQVANPAAGSSANPRPLVTRPLRRR